MLKKIKDILRCSFIFAAFCFQKNTQDLTFKVLVNEINEECPKNKNLQEINS